MFTSEGLPKGVRWTYLITDRMASVTQIGKYAKSDHRSLQVKEMINSKGHKEIDASRNISTSKNRTVLISMDILQWKGEKFAAIHIQTKN